MDEEEFFDEPETEYHDNLDVDFDADEDDVYDGFGEEGNYQEDE